MSQVKVKKPQWNFKSNFVAQKGPQLSLQLVRVTFMTSFRQLTMAISVNPPCVSLRLCRGSLRGDLRSAIGA
jgi:hypothetical protein